MPTSATHPLALLIAATLMTAPMAAWPQPPIASAVSDVKLQPLDGTLPPACETCGTVIAINRVDADALPTLTSEATAAPKPHARPHYEVTIRLNAGTQQIVTSDTEPQLTIGQRVRIIDGVVVPDRG